jgi:hypothetical protein
MKTQIKNGRVVTAVDDYNADIFIDGERERQRAKPGHKIGNNVQAAINITWVPAPAANTTPSYIDMA